MADKETKPRKLVTIVVTEEEVAFWRAAAKADGWRSLSAWARFVMTREAKAIMAGAA